jgi:hypothetical protein
VLLGASVNMKSKKYEENVRGKGRMGNSTYVVINKVKMRARYKQASMVLCKPGLHPPTHRKVYGVPLQRSIQKRGEEKEKKKEKRISTPHQLKSTGALKNPVGKATTFPLPYKPSIGQVLRNLAAPAQEAKGHQPQSILTLV